ncbi:hypothetical protein QR90_08550 [Deinococcus radiopugnans]|uniref:Uncharacterized protein n=1 Tax=Deinococcus radiopugnans TaxID=57497 RepID=A0A0A7KGB0_9DEIO|nr:hypothetical protein [Deinococcus radiopugnans]AIZ45140.1 hypothetical protein QR90_08550 [Deinococcus radiopugnans]
MNDVQLTGHAIARFQERFAGNLGWAAAAQRLARLLRRARFLKVCEGKARLYALGEMRFVVQDGALVTVYRPTYPPVPPTADLWCLS